jgi:hypothetical protein
MSDILSKLENAVQDAYSLFYVVGLPLVQKIGVIYRKLGNSSDSGWVSDFSFITFLGVLQVTADKTFSL